MANPAPLPAVANASSVHPAGNELLARIGDLPSLPTPAPVALRVIQQVSQPNCELEDIARIILLDPGLCAQVLRVVNSALFGLPHPIGSIERALNFLGLKSVRSLVLSLSLPTLRGLTGGDGRLRDCWKASVAAAVVARELAVQLRRPDPVDDMVAALLCDLGVQVLQQTCPAAYAPVAAQTPDVLAFRQCELEEECLGFNHADVSALVLGRWRLPQEITEPIRHHHRPAGAPPQDRALTERSRLLYLAMRVAQLQIAPSSQPALVREVLQLACDQFRLSEGAFLNVIRPLNRKIDEFTGILQLDLGSVAHYPTLVANASVELVRLTLESRAEAAKVGEEKRRTDPEVLRWGRIAHHLRRAATRDRLTGAFNRAYLDEALQQEYRRARRRCTLLGVLILDLDDFQAMNDRFGHALGDQALKDVAATLRRVAGTDDIVGRYGDDEFCVVVPDTTPEALRTAGNRVRHAVGGLLVRHGGAAAKLSASIGAALCSPQRTRHTVADLVAAADRVLVAAKTLGKDGVSFFSLLGDEDAAWLEEVRRRLFSTFLLVHGTVTEPELQAARRTALLPHFLMGRLARRLSWITPRQLRRVLRDQRRHRRAFGETALALGYLTTTQVQTLLALQQEPPEGLAEGLVEVGALTAPQAAAAVAAFYESLAAGAW